MSPERRHLIGRIAAEALELSEHERSAFLDDACAGDAELRRSVEARIANAGVVVGGTVGRYAVEARIGAGGMGEVFLARDERLGRPVALKLIPDASPDDRAAIRRFEREARVVSALNHPNILTIYEVGLFEGVPFIVTEYVEGHTLRERLGRGALPPAEAVAVVAQAAAALAAAHAAGIVHRDVKPENLMVRPDGYVKVLDFGIAKLAGRSTDENTTASQDDLTLLRTGAGVVVGTVPYMSPEQACGAEVDARSDVWSLGVVLYELLAGRAPFKRASSAETIAAILTHEPPALSSVSSAPASLDGVVARALAKNLDLRYARMSEMADDLASLRVDLEIARRGGVAAPPLARNDAADSPIVVVTAAVAVPTVPTTPTNLPRPSTTFVGRTDEIASTVAALDASRLLTLKGEGGIGKTRLALEVASTAAARFPDGVWLVELSHVSDAALVPQAVASALDVREEAGAPLLPRLGAAIAARRILLVLDNCEHVVDACARLATDLLRTCAGLRILATSREPLGIGGEVVWEVRPLSLPDPDITSVAALAHSEAVELFVERARLVRPGFALADDTVEAVAGICRRLDGIALAIELAASKLRVLSPARLLERLDERFAVLVGGDRLAEPRQRTMRAALDWSYELLADEERALLRRLSVFAGGWTLEAAEGVAAAHFETLTALVDKSLVRRAGDDSSDRYATLETIRAYAAERLAATDDECPVRARHFEWFLGLAEAIDGSPGVRTALTSESYAVEEANLRAALRWSIEEGNDPERGLRLAVLLWRRWYPTGRLTEGRAWLASALAGAPDAEASLRGRAARCLSALAQEQGDFRYARDLLESTLADQRARGETAEIAVTLFVLARVAERMGDYAPARASGEEGLAIAREIGDRQLVGAHLNSLGVSAMESGEYDRARELFDESETLFRDLGDTPNLVVVLHNLGEIAFRLGDLATAERLLGETLEGARGLEMVRLAAFTTHMLANVAAAGGDPERARRLYLEALELDRADDARDGVAYVLEGLARMAVTLGEHDRALRLAGAAEGLRRRIGCTLPPFQQAELDTALDASRTALGDAAATHLHAGHVMSTDEVYALAAGEEHRG